MELFRSCARHFVRFARFINTVLFEADSKETPSNTVGATGTMVGAAAFSSDVELRETAEGSYRGSARINGTTVAATANIVKHAGTDDTAFAEACIRIGLSARTSAHGKEELLSLVRAVEASLSRTPACLTAVIGCEECEEQARPGVKPGEAPFSAPSGEGSQHAGKTSAHPALCMTAWSCEPPEHEDDEPRALANAMRDALDAARTLMPLIEALDAGRATPASVHRACNAIDGYGLEATVDVIACLACALHDAHEGYVPDSRPSS